VLLIAGTLTLAVQRRFGRVGPSSTGTPGA